MQKGPKIGRRPLWNDQSAVTRARRESSNRRDDGTHRRADPFDLVSPILGQGVASTPLQPGEANLELNLGTWALNALYALYARYENVLVEKRTLVVKSKIWNLTRNYVYSIQSIEQHYYRETEEQNSNGYKLLVKKDTMLDSLDARERSYDNSTNGNSYNKVWI